MKNLFLILSMITLTLACKKEAIETEKSTNQKTTASQSFRSNLISYSDFIPYGVLHNSYLTNAKDHFSNPPNNLNTLEEAVDYVNDFNMAFTNTLSISNEDKTVYNDFLTASKDYVVTETFMNTFVSPNGSYYQEVQALFDLGGIDEFEKNSLIEIGQKAFDNYNEDLSTSNFKNHLLALKTEWESKNYTIDGQHGYILPIVLSISLHSLDWWENNPDAYGTGTFRALPGWAAADAAGAVAGAVISAGKSIVKDDMAGGGTLDGVAGRAADAAVTGAVSASVGVVAKVKNLIQWFL